MTITQGEHTSPGWTPDDRSFGARLALVRQRMGWGNVKLAALACGLPTESWRTWERDNVEPRRIVEVTALIAAKTGCDRWWLLTGERRPGSADGITTGYPRPTERLAFSAFMSGKPVNRRPNGRPLSGDVRPVPARPARVPRSVAA